MRNLIRTLAALLPLAAACGGVIDKDDTSEGNLLGREIIKLPPLDAVLTPYPALDQSFNHFDNWGTSFKASLVLPGRINADAKTDLVGFGTDGVYVGLSADNHFASVQKVLNNLGSADGWTTTDHVRVLGDINGDGLDDIVAFGYDGVWTALNNGNGGFNPANYVVADLGYASGWRVGVHTRLLADVNTDKCKDIVAFGNAGVYVAMSNCAGSFGPVSFVANELGADQGWNAKTHLRTVADLNNDGRDDIVAFGYDGVWTALSNGSGYDAPHFVLAGFAANSGWNNPARLALGDVDHDGRKDIIGFNGNTVYTARSLGNGTFGAVTKAFGSYNQPFFLDTLVGDLNGDGYVDILASDSRFVKHLLGGPNGFHDERIALVNYDAGRRLLADVDGNGMLDFVLLGLNGAQVARSTSAAASPISPPSNLQMTNPTSTSFNISWVDNSSDEIGFEIEQQPNYSPRYLVGANVTHLNTSTYGNLASNVTYCFHARALSDNRISDWGPQTCATTAGGGSWTPPITICGTSISSCPAGYHPQRFLIGSACSGDGYHENETECAANEGLSFTSCGLSNCPSGYHATGSIYQVDCDLQTTTGNIDPNASTCVRN